METSPFVRSNVCCHTLRKMSNGPSCEGLKAPKEANKQMATPAINDSGAAETWQHASPNRQPTGNEGAIPSFWYVILGC